MAEDPERQTKKSFYEISSRECLKDLIEAGKGEARLN
jgi:hypothetical protein